MVKKNDKTQVTPAAVNALAAGDLGNFMAAITPGGIEAQEKAGQHNLTRKKDRLPVDGTIEGSYGRDDGGKLRKQWEAVGFVFGARLTGADKIFVEATFPAGWSLKPTDHSMWSDVVDDKDRKRAAVFFKAAFYDYNAHTFGLECRYVIDNLYDAKYDPTAYTVKDKATGAILHTVPIPEGTDYFKRDQYGVEAKKWLAENFPDHADPLAYWD